MSKLLLKPSSSSPCGTRCQNTSTALTACVSLQQLLQWWAVRNPSSGSRRKSAFLAAGMEMQTYSCSWLCNRRAQANPMKRGHRLLLLSQQHERDHQHQPSGREGHWRRKNSSVFRGITKSGDYWNATLRAPQLAPASEAQCILDKSTHALPCREEVFDQLQRVIVVGSWCLVWRCRTI